MENNLYIQKNKKQNKKNQTLSQGRMLSQPST